MTCLYRCHACGFTTRVWSGKSGAQTHADSHHGARIEIVQEGAGEMNRTLRGEGS